MELHQKDEDLNALNMVRNHSALYTAAIRRYGSWNDALGAVGFLEKRSPIM